MLIYSREKVLPSIVNMIVLQDAQGAYYYVHRSLYDQSVILTDRYAENPEALVRALGRDTELLAAECVDVFMSIAPSPLKILGYFLYIIDGIDLAEFTLEDICGALHVMSSSVDFRRMLKIPRETRAGIKFSLSVKEEYEVMWDRFLLESSEHEYVASSRQISAPISQELSVNNAETEEDFLALFDEPLDFGLDFSEPEEVKQEEEVAVAIEEQKKPEEQSNVAKVLSALKGVK
jgi:hypothetical protein